MHFDVHKDKNILSVIPVKQRKKSDLLSYRLFVVGCGAPYSILNQYVNTKGITTEFLFCSCHCDLLNCTGYEPV